MKIQIEEKDLLYLLACACNDADSDEKNKWKDEADRTRVNVERIVSEMNKQFGFEKYHYDRFDKDAGIQNVKGEH